MDFAIVHVHSCYTDIQADCASICSLLLFPLVVRLVGLCGCNSIPDNRDGGSGCYYSLLRFLDTKGVSLVETCVHTQELLS